MLVRLLVDVGPLAHIGGVAVVNPLVALKLSAHAVLRICLLPGLVQDDPLAAVEGVEVVDPLGALKISAHAVLRICLPPGLVQDDSRLGVEPDGRVPADELLDWVVVEDVDGALGLPSALSPGWPHAEWLGPDGRVPGDRLLPYVNPLGAFGLLARSC